MKKFRGNMSKIAVLNKHKWIITFLNQVGFRYNIFSSEYDMYHSDCKVIFTENIKAAKDRVLITTHSAYGNYKGRKVREEQGYYYKVSGQQKIVNNSCFFADYPIYVLDVSEGELVGCIFDIHNQSIKGSGILIDGNIVSFPWNIFNLSFSQKNIRRPFYSPVVNKFWVEVGTPIDYGALRRLLEDVINTISKGSIVRYNRFSSNSNGLFAFRVDADGYSKESTNAIIKIIKDTKFRFSWYIDCESWRKQKDDIIQLIKLKQEVGLHCWHHMTYTKHLNNYFNLFIGKKWLSSIVGGVEGVVAPFGYYNSSFEKACLKNNFNYSSEFSYDTDNLPTEVLDDYWQIPVHNGCFGSLRSYGFTDNEIVKHLKYIIDKNIGNDGVAIIYGHPKGRMEEYTKQINYIINYARNKNCQLVTISELLSKWKQVINEENIISLNKKRVYNDMFKYPPKDIIDDSKKDIKYYKEMNISIIHYFFEIIYNYVRMK